MEFRHVVYSSHKLNLEVDRMFTCNLVLFRIIEEVLTTMIDCRCKLKSWVMLRDLRNLISIVHNATRWSGKHLILEGYVKIKERNCY